MNLDDALHSATRVFFDTSPVIYFIEAHPRFEGLLLPIFEKIADGLITAFTSTITLAEVLVLPIRERNLDLESLYAKLLLRSRNFTTVPVDAAIARRTAELRSRLNLRTPDAIQLATALTTECEAFITNDKGMGFVKDLPIIVLDDFRT